METVFTPTTDKRVKLTRKFAKWYLSLPELAGERAISPKHATKITAKMEDGRFIGRTCHIVTIELKGRTYRCNGGHTCTGRLQFNGNQNYLVNHLHFRVKSGLEAAELYAQFDPTWAARTYSHLLNRYVSANGLKKICPMKVLRLAACAIAFDRMGRSESGRSMITGDERARLPGEQPREIRLLMQIFTSPTETRHLQREPVVCAIYQTLLVDAPDAIEFWGMVRDGENLRKTDPPKRLENYLRDNSYNFGRGAQNGRKATFHEMYSKCIHAWNAYRAGRTTNLKVFKDAPLPEPR